MPQDKQWRVLKYRDSLRSPSMHHCMFVWGNGLIDMGDHKTEGGFSVRKGMHQALEYHSGDDGTNRQAIKVK